MRLITFLPPGADAPVAGEARDDQAIAFGDGSTVRDRLASGDLSPATGDSHPLADVGPGAGSSVDASSSFNVRTSCASLSMSAFFTIFIILPDAVTTFAAGNVSGSSPSSASSSTLTGS